MLWKFVSKNRYEMLYYNMSNICLLLNLYDAFLNFLTLQRYVYLLYTNRKNPPEFDGFSFYQDLESQASASVVSSAAGASSVASAFSAAAAAAASALLFANSAIRASLTFASASNLSF